MLSPEVKETQEQADHACLSQHLESLSAGTPNGLSVAYD
jgi:hypothetical protein